MEQELKPLLTGIIILILMVFVYIFFTSPAMVSHDHSNKAIGEIYGSKIVEQSFFATENGLYRIDINMAASEQDAFEDVIFHLKEVNSTRESIVITKNARQIMNNEFNSFIFDPMPDSKGKSYVFSIQSPESNSANSIAIWYNDDSASPYAGGTAFVNNTPLEGDLRFKAYYHTTTSDFISSYLTKLFGDTLFAIFYVILISIAGLGIIWMEFIDGKGKKSE